MTDLINNVDERLKNNDKSINEIIKNISPVLDKVRYKDNLPYLSYIIYLAYNYIKKNKADLPKDWKAWSVVVLKHLFLNGKIINETDIVSIIEDFISYYKQDYENYCEDIIAVTEFDRDYGFILTYIYKKNR